LNRIVSGTRSLYVTGPRPVEAICRANIGQVQALNLLGEPLRRSAAPKGFPDENAAWIDGLAQRLDVANQLVRRRHDRSQTGGRSRPWRRRSTASTGLTGI
ncbi:MAG: hypothetical protein WA624_03855, partial [Methylocella sp.]